MKLVVDRGQLLKSLGYVHSVVERRGTIPILANVKIEAASGAMELMATDMDIAEMDSTPAEVEQSGGVTVPAQMLYEIVRKLPDGSQVRLVKNSNSSQIDISAGSAQFVLPTMPIEEYPAIAEGDLPNSFVLAATECRELLEKTRYAVAQDETRYYLNGVYLHAAMDGENQVLRAVATDGHRLAQMQVACPAGASDMPGVILPRKTVNEIISLMDQGATEVKISLSSHKIKVVAGTAVVISKLIDGSFPDYTRVIPAGNTIRVEVNAKAFSRSVDRVAVVSSERARGVRLTIQDGRMVLSASGQDQGTAQEELDVACSTTEILEAGFNHRYLLDALSSVAGEKACLLMADANSPTIIRDTGNPNLLAVIMPMRV